MKIVVLAGGLSSERDVSLQSGRGICQALIEQGHQAVMVDVFLGMPGETGSFDEVYAGSRQAKDDFAGIGTLEPDVEKVKAMRTGETDGFFGEHVLALCREADMVYMGLHGAEGENGKIQAALDVLGIPYTGSGYLGCALAMDKGLAKQLFMQAGVPGASGFVRKKGEEEGLPEGFLLPCVVKPCCGGSSVGVGIVDTLEEYEKAVKKAFLYEDQLIIEEYIKGREFSVGVMGGKALPVIEIIPKGGFYDYEKKYQADMATEVCPAQIDTEQTRKMQRYAVMVYQALHLECYARVDFIMDASGAMYCLEANALPGMTHTSLLPQEAVHVGLSYGELCDQVIALALAKYNEGEKKLSAAMMERDDVLYTPADRKHLPGQKRKGLTPAKIAEVCEGTLYGCSSEAAAKEVTGVTLDSRQVIEGSLFIATKGERVDGNQFLSSAYEKGALCCMSEREWTKGNAPYIKVENCFEALKKLAAYYRKQCRAKVIGVTGSVGKTTTKEMIASVLSQKYYTMKTLGNFNNEIGLPLTLLRIEEGDEMAVVEMGISDFGEMSRLAQIAVPDMMVLTNIGDCHLENLGDRDGVLRAKTEVFDYVKEDIPVFLGGEDEKLAAYGRREKFLHPVHYFGIGKDNDVYAKDISYLGLSGIHLCIVTPQGDFETTIPVPGKHMIANALCATAVGLACGLQLTEIARGIEAFTPIGGRSNLIHTHRYTIMDDCYNANPVSMKAGLDVLSLVEGRKVAILGDMFELGEREEQMHQEVGCHAKECGVDVLICIGKLAACLAAGAAGLDKEAVLAATEEVLPVASGDMTVIHCDTFEQAKEIVGGVLQKGDSVLIKASHGMHLERMVQYLCRIAEE